MNAIDPVGMEERKNRKLKRRVYFSAGPNENWSYDGHDKLKRYGLLMHGCIDVWSRYVIWLKVHVTNHDPRVIARYYLDAVKKIGGMRVDSQFHMIERRNTREVHEIQWECRL
jgi:hypothetical protein